MLITTGIETVEDVFDPITFFFRCYKQSQDENLILRNYVTLNQSLLIVYDIKDTLIYSSAGEVSAFLRNETRRLLKKVRESGSLSVIRKNNKKTYIMAILTENVEIFSTAPNMGQ